MAGEGCLILACLKNIFKKGIRTLDENAQAVIASRINKKEEN
jgi:hypothetical protein